MQSLKGRATQSILQLRGGGRRLDRSRARGPAPVGAGARLAWLHARADAAARLGGYLSAAFLVATAAYGAALGGHMAQWRAQAEARIEAALLAGGFGVEEVIVKGRVHADPALIDEALGADRARTIFGFDTRASRARLERIGWVESARVMRLWPSTLVVELHERSAIARWRIRGHEVLIDRGGELLGPVTPDFAALPRIAGESAHLAAAALLDGVARQPALAERLARADRVEGRRWDLLLQDGRRVLLPAEGWERALRLLERLLAGTLPRAVTAVDLRVAGRIALRRGGPATEPHGATAQIAPEIRRAHGYSL